MKHGIATTRTESTADAGSNHAGGPLRACGQRVHSLPSDQRGGGLVEHILVVGLIALGAVSGSLAFGRSMEATATSQAACITTLDCAGGGSAVGALPSTAGARSTDGTAAASTPTTWSQRWNESPAGLVGHVFSEVLKGAFYDGLGGTILGLAQLILVPTQTAKGIGHALAHPVETATATIDGLVASARENPERFAGRVIFEVATAFAFVKWAKAAEARTAVKVADKADDAVNW